jgi:hypothetical protein
MWLTLLCWCGLLGSDGLPLPLPALQSFKELVDEEFPATPGGSRHTSVVQEIKKEVAALLSPACRGHPNVIALTNVVVDAERRPVKLVFETADQGDLKK